MIWHLAEIITHCNTVQRQTAGGAWVPAQPEPAPLSFRIRAAWAVLRGRADAFVWPDQNGDAT